MGIYLSDAIAQFKSKMISHGIEPPEHIFDTEGKFKRFKVVGSNGRSANKNGWYFLNCNGIPHGAFGNWATGLTVNWVFKSTNQFNTYDFKKNLESIQKQKEERMKLEIKTQEEAASSASIIWHKATEAPNDFPYLKAKGVNANGVRLISEQLVIPMFDKRDLITSLQMIAADGSKKFLKGGKIKGSYFKLGILEQDTPLCICEGFATAASIFEAVGYSTIAAMNAGNLLSVAEEMRSKFPNRKIIICADDDAENEINIGKIKGEEAARAVGGYFIAASSRECQRK